MQSNTPNRPNWPQTNPNNRNRNSSNFPMSTSMTEEERRRLDRLRQNAPSVVQRGRCNRTCG